jgi:DedD protein
MMDRNQRGLSTRHLIMFFFAGVAVCGVFFALGFLVGYNQRPSAAAQVETERLVAAGAVPPAVNPPPAEEKSSDDQSAAPPPSPSTDAAAEARAQSEAVKPKKGSRPTPEVSETDLVDGPSSTGGNPAGRGGAATMPAGFVIQLAASSARQDADTLVGVLKTRGYSAFAVTPEQAKLGDKLYRVEVGPFSTREQADKVRQKLVSEGFKPFIRRD